MSENQPKPSAPTKKLSVKPSKDTRKGSWSGSLRIANRVDAETVRRLAVFK